MTHVIWDWNGTLLDDMALSIEGLNMLLAENGYPQQYNETSYKEIFGFPIVEYYARAGFDFDRHSFVDLAQQYIDFYTPKSRFCSLATGAEQTLATLQNAGVHQVILSASKQETLAEQAEHFGVTGFFDELVGINDHYAASKLERGQSWLAQSGLDPKNAVFVGDTLHDAEVAKALGMPCVLCAAGHQSRTRLATAGVPMINDLTELCAFLGV